MTDVSFTLISEHLIHRKRHLPWKIKMNHPVAKLSGYHYKGHLFILSDASIGVLTHLSCELRYGMVQLTNFNVLRF
jgi:hypothetical protein